MLDISMTEGLYPSNIMVHCVILFAKRHLPTNEGASLMQIDRAIDEAPPHIEQLGSALQNCLIEYHKIDQQNSKGEKPIGEEQLERLHQQIPENLLFNASIEIVASIATVAYSGKHQPQTHKQITNRFIAENLGLEPKPLDMGQDTTPYSIYEANRRIIEACNHFKEITGKDA